MWHKHQIRSSDTPCPSFIRRTLKKIVVVVVKKQFGLEALIAFAFSLVDDEEEEELKGQDQDQEEDEEEHLEEGCQVLRQTVA